MQPISLQTIREMMQIIQFSNYLFPFMDAFLFEILRMSEKQLEVLIILLQPYLIDSMDDLDNMERFTTILEDLAETREANKYVNGTASIKA